MKQQSTAKPSPLLPSLQWLRLQRKYKEREKLLQQMIDSAKIEVDNYRAREISDTD